MIPTFKIMDIIDLKDNSPEWIYVMLYSKKPLTKWNVYFIRWKEFNAFAKENNMTETQATNLLGFENCILRVARPHISRIIESINNNSSI